MDNEWHQKRDTLQRIQERLNFSHEELKILENMGVFDFFKHFIRAISIAMESEEDKRKEDIKMLEWRQVSPAAGYCPACGRKFD